MQIPPFIDHNGRRYHLQSTGRYYNCRTKVLGQRLLHRVVWTEVNGTIPDGFEIHHKNEDWTDNRIENLECLHATQHQREHMLEKYKDQEFRESALRALERAQAAAKEWHASDEGREWHSEHGKASWDGREPVICKCTVCGGDYESFFPSRSRFCSKACAQKESYQRYKSVAKNCAFCGAEFTANKYRNTECCSRACGCKLRAVNQRLAKQDEAKKQMTEALNPTQKADADRLMEATEQINELLDLNDDTPLMPVCDLSGDKTCESCQ